MDFILRKNKPNDEGTISDSALFKLLLDKLSGVIDSITKEAATKEDIHNILKDLPVITKDTITNLLSVDDIITLGRPISIVAGNIEAKITKPGIIYYNPLTDELRLRKKDKWITVA